MKYTKNLILRNIAGEAVLVPVGAAAREFNGLITLSTTAKTIWENMTKVSSAEEMIALILDEYEIDEETARKDVLGFTSELVEKGFASYTDPEKKW